jgi:hypothetical protein
VRIGDTEVITAADISKNSLCRFERGTRPADLSVIECDPPVAGRFITVQIKDSSAENVLAICELQPMFMPRGELIWCSWHLLLGE